MGIKKYVLLCPVFACFIGFSQEDHNQEENAYVRGFPEKVTVRLGIQNTSNSFVVTDNQTHEQVYLNPNDKTYLGISLLFRSIGIDLGYAPNFFSENRDNKGSKLFTLNFRMFMGKWMQTLDFYRQKGFFAVVDDESIPFPQFGTLKIGGTTSYILNDNFSFRAIGFQNEWQMKSAGSFIPSLTGYYTKFNLRDTDFRSEGHSVNLAIGPGYYYNWIIKEHFILSAGSTLGFGVNISSSDGETSTTGLVQATFRASIGYNSERFFTGINLNSQILANSAEQDMVLNDSINFGEIYLGYRFNAPKKWLKKADAFNRKFDL